MTSRVHLIAVVATAATTMFVADATEDPPALQAVTNPVSQADDITLADYLDEDMGRLRRHLADAVYARLLAMAGHHGDAEVTDTLIQRFLHGDDAGWADFSTAFAGFCEQIAIHHGPYADYTLYLILNTEAGQDGSVLSDICQHVCERVADHLVANRGFTLADVRRRVLRIVRNGFADASGGWICVSCTRGQTDPNGSTGGRRCWYDPVSGQLEEKTVATAADPDDDPNDEPADADPGGG